MSCYGAPAAMAEALAVAFEGRVVGETKVMAFMRGKPLVTKVAAVAKYGLLPGAMVVALVYSPPDYSSSSKKK